MLTNFEVEYCQLVQDILDTGQDRRSRAGNTRGIFGASLGFDLSDDLFPLVFTRNINYKAAFGELAAMFRGPHHVEDFERFGCNYWKAWADEQGYLTLDYGNLWNNFGGVNQLDELRRKLIMDPYDRRMIVSGWNPAHMAELSLPCCHMLYQWYVRDGMYLDMLWYQRSADTMIGIPFDAVLAAAWNIMLANDVKYKPGRVTMIFGDTHIYENHLDGAHQFLNDAFALHSTADPHFCTYDVAVPKSYPFTAFEPDNIVINGYNPSDFKHKFQVAV